MNNILQGLLLIIVIVSITEGFKCHQCGAGVKGACKNPEIDLLMECSCDTFKTNKESYYINVDCKHNANPHWVGCYYLEQDVDNEYSKEKLSRHGCTSKKSSTCEKHTDTYTNIKSETCYCELEGCIAGTPSKSNGGPTETGQNSFYTTGNALKITANPTLFIVSSTTIIIIVLNYIVSY